MRGSRAVVLLLVAVLAGCSRSPEATAAHLADIPVNAILADPSLRATALEAGAAVYRGHCATCHGGDLKGAPGRHAPDLTDDFWLFTGDDVDNFVMHPSDVEKTIRFGIRAASPKTRNLADMPARGADGDLTPAEIAAVADYVMKLSGRAADPMLAEAGRKLYLGKGECFDCHDSTGLHGGGDGAVGAADLLRPDTWLYGSDRAAVRETIERGRRGVSPAFDGVLSPDEIKAAAIYVYSAAAKTAF